MYCKACGYNLKMLPEPCCPECGRRFDPADRRTFRAAPKKPWTRWLWRIGALLLAFALAVGAAWGWMYWGWRQEQAALAKLPGCRVLGTTAVGPPWLRPRLRRAGFVLERVRVLSGMDSAVSDITPVAKLTRLQSLGLHHTRIADLSPLANLTGLERLYLSNTSVTDLAPLAKLTRLQRLFLSGTPVTDLSPLANLTELEELFLNNSRVTDASPLKSLVGLRELHLPSNRASYRQLPDLQKALPECHIYRD